MGALASIATLVGAGASIYGTVRQAQQTSAVSRAQAQQAQTQEVVRQDELTAARAADARNRSATLARTLATARARLAAGGVSPDQGSGAALAAGLRADAAADAGEDDALLRARLARGRASLLAPDGTLNAVLQSGRALGSIARNLLD